MRRIFLCVLVALLAALALIPCASANVLEPGVYDAYAAAEYTDLTYGDYMQMSEDEKAAVAASYLVDICGHEPDLFGCTDKGQKGFSAVYSVPVAGESSTWLSFFYIMEDSVWALSCDTANPALVYQPMFINGPSVDAELAVEILAQVLPPEIDVELLDRGMFWQHAVEIAAYMAELYAPEGQTAEGQFGGAEYDPEGPWPVEVRLRVEMAIEEGMSDFQFRVNGGEPFPATPDRENNVVTGSFTVTKNGMYRVELGYRYNHQPYSQTTDVTIEGIDESILENHEHVYETAYDETHPHVKLVCVCGEEMPVDYELLDSGNTQIFHSPDCCECVGHIWETPFLQADGKLRSTCARIAVCGYSRYSDPTAAWHASRMISDLEQDMGLSYYRDDGTKGTLPAWRIYTRSANSVLQNEFFVYGTGTLDAYSDMTGTVVDTAGDLSSKAIGIDRWENQKKELWKELVVELLTDRAEVEDSHMIEEVASVLYGTTKSTHSSLSAAYKFAENFSELEISSLDARLTTLIEQSEDMEAIGDLDVQYADAVENAASNKEVSKTLGKIGTVFKVLNMAGEAVNAADQAQETVDRLVLMLAHYNRNINILNELIASAEAVGNEPLIRAASEVKAELQANVNADIDSFLLISTAMLEKTAHTLASKSAEEVIKEGVDFAVDVICDEFGVPDMIFKDAGSMLGIVELASKSALAVLEWDDLIKEAQLLSTYEVMSSDLDVHNALEDTNSYYSAELWALLQIKAAGQAKAFITAYDDALGARVDDPDGVRRSLDSDILDYENFLTELYELGV